MKVIIAWILLAIYVNASAQTLLPFVKDVLAHTFFWHDHMEHVHHGDPFSRHVHDEMAAFSHSHGESDSHPVVPINQDALSAHLVPIFVEPTVLLVSYFTVLNPYDKSFVQQAVPLLFSPPPDSSRA